MARVLAGTARFWFCCRGNKLIDKEKGILASVSAGAVWTQSMLLEANYDGVDGLCKLCGCELDTVHHRLYVCRHPTAVAIRNKLCTKSFLHTARQSSACSALYTKAIFKHPGEDVPLPSMDPFVDEIKGA